MFHAPAGLIATSAHTAPPARLSRPGTVAEALRALGEAGAVAVAGGTDLCARYNEGATPRLLVSLDRLEGLRGIEVADDAIRIGACVTHAQGSGHAGLRAALPGFSAAWAMIANPRVRFRGTIGGNLMAGRTRYEMPLLLAALGARLCFEGPLLTQVEVPRRPGQRFLYMRGLRPQLTLAVHRHEGGGLAAIGTEHLSPVTIPLEDLGLETLPAAFADHGISHWYARRAGAALLRRALQALDAGHG